MAYIGGPYDEKLYPAEIAKIKASAFVNEIIQHRYRDFKVYEIIGAWSEWYFGIVCDYTYFLFDEANGAFWILAVTDSD